MLVIVWLVEVSKIQLVFSARKDIVALPHQASNLAPSSSIIDVILLLNKRAGNGISLTSSTELCSTVNVPDTSKPITRKLNNPVKPFQSC